MIDFILIRSSFVKIGAADPAPNQRHGLTLYPHTHTFVVSRENGSTANSGVIRQLNNSEHRAEQLGEPGAKQGHPLTGASA
jgi:hypothetical protein